MKKFFKSYKQSLFLLLGIIVGCIIGLIFKDNASVLSPLGDLFLNLMFVIIVPLIFLNITTSIAKISSTKKISKLLTTILMTFLVMNLVACFVGIIGCYSTKLVDASNPHIMESLTEGDVVSDDLNILERTVKLVSVSDFNGLLSKNNIIAIVIFSILVGIAINKTNEDGKKFLEVLESANKVVLKLVDVIFWYAPIGLGSYFASLVGTYGSSIALGYLKTFLVYLVISAIFYLFIYTFYAYLSYRRTGVKRFWKNIFKPSITAISTCSSAACIPINIKSAKDIGVSNEIAETTIPLGTSFHKDGSAIGSVFKIMFLAYLFNMNVFSFSYIGKVIGVSLIANLLVTAIPIGGGTISEMLILTMMDFPLGALPILTMIATIIDAPATLLNSVGDIASSMVVNRLVDKKTLRD